MMTLYFITMLIVNHVARLYRPAEILEAWLSVACFLMPRSAKRAIPHTWVHAFLFVENILVEMRLWHNSSPSQWSIMLKC